MSGYNFNCKKIDIYVNGIYWRSTNQSKTCKEAKLRVIEQFKYNPDIVKCHFAK